jgi:hypothetical protein
MPGVWLDYLQLLMHMTKVTQARPACVYYDAVSQQQQQQ